MYEEVSDKQEARLKILQHLPQVTKIDGDLVKPFEVESAKRLVEE